jgi:glycosyltransferase involved in cell wall biosynthesis
MHRLTLVHNFYGSEAPSGENAVVVAERRLLESHGHATQLFSRESDTIRADGLMGAVKGGVSSVWNPFTAASLRKEIRAFSSDIVHVHNVFPLISPSIFSAIAQQAARVLTLHNYRLFCAAAIPMRDGVICTTCIDRKSALPALQHGCYRNNRLATVPLAMGIELHRRLGTWHRHVDAFIALSEFQKAMMIEAGLPAHKVHVKPNFFPGNPVVKPWLERSTCALFVGRLSAEKGVQRLLDVWAEWGDNAPPLRIVGDGPLRRELEIRAARLPVTFLGSCSADVTMAEISAARLLVLPSECLEGFPMVLAEAFAAGTPVAVPRLGPLPSIVHSGLNGVVFEAFSRKSMLSTLRTIWNNSNQLKQLALGARESFERLYNDEMNYLQLIDIYNQALEVCESRVSRK